MLNIRVILEEQLFHLYNGEFTDGRVQGKPKVNEYLSNQRTADVRNTSNR